MGAQRSFSISRSLVVCEGDAVVTIVVPKEHADAIAASQIRGMVAQQLGSDAHNPPVGLLVEVVRATPA
jgi:hypothetical protein